jgi:hypothetical protein
MGLQGYVQDFFSGGGNLMDDLLCISRVSFGGGGVGGIRPTLRVATNHTRNI